MEQFLAVLQRLVDQIETNLDSEVNIANLSRTFGISPFYLQRLFKALVGDSLGQYIRGRRLTRAGEMILETRSGLLDIGFAVGFNSHEAFSRSFKAYFNKTPSEFRSERPSVLLNKKPVLTLDLFEYLKKGLQRDPRIVQSEPQLVVGLPKSIQSPLILEEGFCAEADQVWMDLAGRYREIQYPTPGTFFGITASPSGDFTEDQVDFLAGLAVSRIEALPDGMSQVVLPKGQVAQFEQMRIEPNKYKETIDYIYGYWLPNSAYTRASGVDYVLVEGMLEFGKPHSVKYVIPVQDK